jgi:hypothetical protein
LPRYVLYRYLSGYTHYGFGECTDNGNRTPRIFNTVSLTTPATMQTTS